MEAITATRPAIGSELVELAVRGDEAAFTRIVAAHHADMLKVCLAVCGDIEVAEEAVQAAWSLAWRRLPSLRDADRLRPWLISIAANQARDALRHRKRRPVVELAVTDGDVGGGDGGAGDPARRAGDIDLRNAMAKLDPTDRALVALRYVAGLDSFELARGLGMSPSGTRARLARILDRLRTELGDA
jgi:RNA polymerase sigma factor (sigma-70 family)